MIYKFTSCPDEPFLKPPIGPSLAASTRPKASAGAGQLSGLLWCSAGPQRICRAWFIWEATKTSERDGG